MRWEMRAEGAGMRMEALFPKAAWGIHVGRGPGCAFTAKVPRSVPGTFIASNIASNDAPAAGGVGGTPPFRTPNDDITLENVDGAVAVSTTNGDMTLDPGHATGAAQARMSRHEEVRIERKAWISWRAAAGR